MKTPEGPTVLVVARAASFSDGCGGLERAVGDQARALAATGARVALIAPREWVTGEPSTQLIDVSWPLPDAGPGKPGFGLVYWLWVRRAAREIRAIAPGLDGIYLHGGAAGALKWRKQWPAAPVTVVNPHGMEEFQRAGLRRWMNRVFTRRLSRYGRFADWIIATDRSTIPAVVRHIGAPIDRVAVIPNAVDVEQLDKLAQLGTTGVGQPADVVTVGRLVHNKGYDLLAQALASGSWENLVWRHFGAGPERDLIESIIARANGVRFEIVEGAADALVQANLRNARVFVQPSRYEGSSLTTLEAMAQRTICVGTPVGGIGDKLRNCETGFLAAAASADAIEAALAKALVAPQSVGEAARSLVEAEFSLKSTTRSLAAILADSQSSSVPPTLSPPQVVFQVARHIGDGAGVSQVVKSLERALTDKRVVVGSYTLKDAGIGWNTQISSRWLAKLALMTEVIWFTISGTVAARRLAAQGVDVIVHGDPVGGTLFVNHGLLKASRRARGLTRRIPLNPMHWFTLARDRYRYDLRADQHIVCLTTQDVNELQREYPHGTSTIHVIPNGVDAQRFRPASKAASDDLRTSMGISKGDFALLFVGHEYVRKGLGLIIDALPQLDRRFKLLVLGGSDSMIEQEQRSLDPTLRDRVHFLGRRSDVASYYQAADALVLPSAYETGPLVLLEALACGLPAVITPVGLAEELVVDGINGALVTRSATGVAAGVMSVGAMVDLDEAAVRERCVGSVASFGWDAIADRYLEALNHAKASARIRTGRRR